MKRLLSLILMGFVLYGEALAATSGASPAASRGWHHAHKPKTKKEKKAKPVPPTIPPLQTR